MQSYSEKFGRSNIDHLKHRNFGPKKRSQSSLTSWIAYNTWFRIFVVWNLRTSEAWREHMRIYENFGIKYVSASQLETKIYVIQSWPLVSLSRSLQSSPHFQCPPSFRIKFPAVKATQQWSKPRSFQISTLENTFGCESTTFITFGIRRHNKHFTNISLELVTSHPQSKCQHALWHKILRCPDERGCAWRQPRQSTYLFRIVKTIQVKNYLQPATQSRTPKRRVKSPSHLPALFLRSDALRCSLFSFKYFGDPIPMMLGLQFPPENHPHNVQK